VTGRSGSVAGGLQVLVEDATAHRVPPGLAAAVVTAGGAAEFVTGGLADVGARRPVTASTTFLWFSMTKIVTATAAMMLADRGALDLDAPVIEHVPEMRVLRRPGPLITARHLLSHSSGLANPPPVRRVRPAGVPPPDARAFLGDEPHRLRARPRARRHRHRLLAAPAGRAGGPAAAAPPGIVGQRAGGLVAFPPFYVNGPPYGGLVGDVQDAARFLALHLGDGAVGGRRLLSAGSAVAMRTLTTTGRKLTTGLGWWRRHEADDGSGLVEHLGGGGAYRNLMRLYPDSGQAVVMFGNLTSYPVEHLAAAILASGTGCHVLPAEK
jgi:CubicO group peptidase (beta-lactamase class C family)